MDDLISSVYRSATLQFPSCYFSFDVIQWSWQKAKAGSVGRHLNWWVTRTVLNFNVTNKGGEERKKKKKPWRRRWSQCFLQDWKKLSSATFPFLCLATAHEPGAGGEEKTSCWTLATFTKYSTAKMKSGSEAVFPSRPCTAVEEQDLFNSSKDHDNYLRQE